MRTAAPKPTTTPMPVQRSAPEFEACLWPPLAMPKRGPTCTLGYDRVFHLLLWVLYTGMQWKRLPVPHDPQGKPAMHAPTVDTGFARWADEGALWQAFVARVRPRAAAKQLDLRVLHGDGTHTGAKPGGRAWGMRGTNTSRARTASRSSTILALA